jgi:hypothetical protein
MHYGFGSVKLEINFSISIRYQEEAVLGIPGYPDLVGAACYGVLV